MDENILRNVAGNVSDGTGNMLCFVSGKDVGSQQLNGFMSIDMYTPSQVICYPTTNYWCWQMSELSWLIQSGFLACKVLLVWH